MERVTSYPGLASYPFGFSGFPACQEASLFFRGLLFSHFRRTVHSYVRCERDLSCLMPMTRSTREGILTERTFSSLTGLSCALAYLTVRSSSVRTNIQNLYSLSFKGHIFTKETGWDFKDSQHFTLAFWRQMCRQTSGTSPSPPQVVAYFTSRVLIGLVFRSNSPSFEFSYIQKISPGGP